jgi:hypothetical protein
MADRLTAIDEPGFTAFWAVKLGDQVYWVKPERPISDETLEEWLTRMERGFGVHRSNIVAITKEQYEMIPRSDDEPVSVGWLPYE